MAGELKTGALKERARAHILNNEHALAEALLHQVCNINSDDAEAWSMLGTIAWASRNHELAEKCFSRVASLNPASSKAHYDLACVYIAKNNIHEAMSELGKALSIDSNFTEARLRIAAVLQNSGMIEESTWHLTIVLQQDPDNLEARLRYSNNLILSGNTDDAFSTLQELHARNPDSPSAATSLASLLIRRGDISAAQTILDPFLNREDVSPTIAITFADICHYMDRCEEAVGILERLLLRPDLTADSRRGIHYALGKLYDRSREYDKAFRSIAEANSLKRVNFDTRALVHSIDAIIASWTTGFDNNVPSASFQFGRTRPVFIVGMPRSGTTIVEQILASHPDVFGAGELKEIGNAMLRLQELSGSNMQFPDYLAQVNMQMIDQAANEYLDFISSVSEGKFGMVTNKMPQNFWHLGLIRKLFPMAKIIHCRRNPLDTCVSCFFTDFADGNEFSFNLEHLGTYYTQYLKLMRHWKETISIPMLEIRYEDLVNNPEALSRQLVEYCELEWDENCLKPHKTRRDVLTASTLQVRERIYTSSTDRWKHYAGHLRPLMEILGEPDQDRAGAA